MSGGGGWGSGARAILYERPNLSGRSFVVDSDVAANLATMGFNDRASSLRVERGHWVLCSRSEFRGECRTFGPGDYAHLPRELDKHVIPEAAQGLEPVHELAAHMMQDRQGQDHVEVTACGQHLQVRHGQPVIHEQ